MTSDHTKAQIFTPIQFAGIRAENRAVMAPMVTNFATPENQISDKQITYYAERAKGGIGTIIVEASAVNAAARAFGQQVGIYGDHLISGLEKLSAAIRESGAVSLIQLHHAGPKVNTEIGLEAVSVSPVMIRKGVVPRQLTSDELLSVRGDFVRAAHRAYQAGFDGVELHAGHFYLLGASISPYTNKRQDAYGGDIYNRTRLTREIIQDVKSEIGSDFVVWVRINGCEALDPGLSMDESGQVAAIFEEAGADAIHVSAYTIPTDKSVKMKLHIPVGASPGKDTPPGPFLDFARSVKERVRIPVVAVGKLDDPKLAENALCDGKCDMVALGRQLLCDPYWVSKVRDQKEADIIHCKYCESCHRALHNGEPIICAQNLNLYGVPAYKIPHPK